MQAELLERYKADFEFFAWNCLKIRTKSGAIVPFQLNRAQRRLHERLEAQRASAGRVRAIIVKGRQLGASTYIQARFYWRLWAGRGLKAFILTHEQDATDNLFGMAQRFHDNVPPIMRPRTKAANAKELAFADNDCSYAVATAGTKGVGRSNTLQLFHGSEAGFWPNAETHIDGAFQAIADVDGTERLLESTGNGLGNVFQRRYKAAERGDSDEEAIFIPWFWGEDYALEVPEGWSPPPAAQREGAIGWEEYRHLHGLTAEQLYWAYCKNRDMANALGESDDEPCWKFKQEYPATADEAFQTSGHDSFIKPVSVLRARKANFEGIGKLVIGADPARFGDDRFSVAWRRGRKVEKIESRAKLDTVQGANWLKGIIDRDKPARMFIDVGGIGAGVVDMLNSWGAPYEDVIEAVNFGGEPQDDIVLMPDGEQRPGPRNRRAEMWKRSKDWLADVGGADLPDLDSLQADACAPRYKYDLNQRLLLESKEDMRRRGVPSPDEWDAVALTFASPVKDEPERETMRRPRGAGGWMG